MTAKERKEKQAWIKATMKSLQITEQDAEELWLFDHDEITNEVADSYEEKAEEMKKKPKEDRLAKVKRLKAKEKADENKDQIISIIADCIDANSTIMINPFPIKKNRISFKDKDGNYYTVAITKHKSRPDGYKESEEQTA